VGGRPFFSAGRNRRPLPVRDAVAPERQLKKWERRWKLELIERFNPDWRDLYETLNN
jgi:putative endonuclease